MLRARMKGGENTAMDFPVGIEINQAKDAFYD
jgi:hypothetical protein